MILKCFIILLVCCSYSSPLFATLSDGLIGWWKFNESSGNAIDSSWQDNDGIPTGTTILSNCKVASCRRFNGTSDYIDLGSSKTYITTNAAFSVAFWMYATDFSTSQRTLFHLKSDGVKDWASVLLDNAAYRDFNWGTHGANTSRISFPSTITNKWWHITIVYNGAGDLNAYTNYTFYLNGVNTTVNSGGNFVIGGNISVLGSNAIPASAAYQGSLDDFRVYNRALTAEEAKDLSLPGVKIGAGVVGAGKINQ